MARPLAGDRPKPTLDMVATTALPAVGRPSITGRPSGVFSTIPAQLRMTRTCRARGNISPRRLAMLRAMGLDGRKASEPVPSAASHSCGPPP